MKCANKLPEDYTDYSNTLSEVVPKMLVTYEGVVDPEVESAIKYKPLFARYVNENFSSRIWWDPKTNSWIAKVWQNKAHVGSYHNGDILTLTREIQRIHSKTNLFPN